MKKLFFIICITIAAAANSQAIKPAKAKPIESSVNQKADTVKAASPTGDSTQVKLLTIQGTIEGFQALFSALDKSTESHVIIESLKQWLVPQINEQLQPKPPAKN